jgi:hypothetical protein
VCQEFIRNGLVVEQGQGWSSNGLDVEQGWIKKELEMKQGWSRKELKVELTLLSH